jgi:hypothetical protein
VTIDEAAEIAVSLPDVTEATRYANRVWIVAGRVFAWQRPFSKADIRRFGDAAPPSGPILAVRVGDLDDKAAILTAGLQGVFTIPHFDGYAAILIQLDRAEPAEVREALVDGWLACASKDLASRYLRTNP